MYTLGVVKIDCLSEQAFFISRYIYTLEAVFTHGFQGIFFNYILQLRSFTGQPIPASWYHAIKKRGFSLKNPALLHPASGTWVPSDRFANPISIVRRTKAQETT